MSKTPFQSASKKELAKRRKDGLKVALSEIEAKIDKINEKLDAMKKTKCEKEMTMAKSPFIPLSKEDFAMRKAGIENEERAWLEEFKSREGVKQIRDGSYDVNGDLDVSGIFYSRVKINNVKRNYICGEHSFPDPQDGPKKVGGNFTYDRTGNPYELGPILKDFTAKIDGMKKFCPIGGKVYLRVGGLGFGGIPQPLTIEFNI